MAPTTPTGPPAQAIAGDTWIWKVPDLSDYPQSEGWSLKYELAGKSTTLTITPVYQTSGDDVNNWLATVATTDSDDLDAGLYTLVLRAVGSGDYSGEEYTINQATGNAVRAEDEPWRIQVARNPRTAGAGDAQLFAERMLEIVEAALEGRLTKDMESYSIGGRSITKISFSELKNYRKELSNELNAIKSGQLGRDVEAVFNRA